MDNILLGKEVRLKRKKNGVSSKTKGVICEIYGSNYKIKFKKKVLVLDRDDFVVKSNFRLRETLETNKQYRTQYMKKKMDKIKTEEELTNCFFSFDKPSYNYTIDDWTQYLNSEDKEMPLELQEKLKEMLEADYEEMKQDVNGIMESPLFQMALIVIDDIHLYPKPKKSKQRKREDDKYKEKIELREFLKGKPEATPERIVVVGFLLGSILGDKHWYHTLNKYIEQHKDSEECNERI